MKILKDNIADWKIGNKEGRYGIKSCGKKFKLNNKTYTNTERHQMPDVFEYSSMVRQKYFVGMKLIDLFIGKDCLDTQKTILSRDDGYTAPQQYGNISMIVENSHCKDIDFTKLVSSLWSEGLLSQKSFVNYCDTNNMDIEKLEHISAGVDHRRVMQLSSTASPDFIYIVQLLARVNKPYLLDYCKYILASIAKVFCDRASVLHFFATTLDLIQNTTQ